jgi:hypothetical protein
VLPGGAAFQVERIGDAIRPDDAGTGGGEGIAFLHPAGAIDTHEAKALGVFTRAGIMDIKVNPYARGYRILQ